MKVISAYSSKSQILNPGRQLLKQWRANNENETENAILINEEGVQ